MGVFIDWLNGRIFLWPFFTKLATMRSRPFKFSSAMIVLFIPLFSGLSFLPFFHFFLFLNLFWRCYLCHFCFLLSAFTSWYFNEKVWLSLVEFRLVLHEWVVQGSKEKNGLVANWFPNHYLLCVTIISTPCFQLLPEEKLLRFTRKSFCLTKGFFDSGLIDLMLQQVTLANAYIW